MAKTMQESLKWFNMKNGYGFITRHDTQKDTFVPQTAITRNNSLKYQRCVATEKRWFHVVQGERGTEGANVTGPVG